MVDIDYTPSGIEEILTKEFVRWIDKTPTTTPTWVVVGVGVEDGNANIEYNPQVDRTKWIIDKNARTSHKSNDKQMPITQTCYKNDPEFEFINDCRDKMNNKTHVLEVDTWNGNLGNYPARQTDATIVINTYNGNEITYTIYFDGDGQEGTATLSGNVPTFTPSTSL